MFITGSTQDVRLRCSSNRSAVSCGWPTEYGGARYCSELLGMVRKHVSSPDIRSGHLDTRPRGLTPANSIDSPICVDRQPRFHASYDSRGRLPANQKNATSFERRGECRIISRIPLRRRRIPWGAHSGAFALEKRGALTFGKLIKCDRCREVCMLT